MCRENGTGPACKANARVVVEFAPGLAYSPGGVDSGAIAGIENGSRSRGDSYWGQKTFKRLAQKQNCRKHNQAEKQS